MSEENKEQMGKRPFDRFDAAMKVILSVPKPVVVAEEKKQQGRRKAERLARKERRTA